MADATFIAYGSSVLADPQVNTTSGTGNEGAGEITITSGQSVFAPDAIVEILVNNVNIDGEITGT